MLCWTRSGVYEICKVRGLSWFVRLVVRTGAGDVGCVSLRLAKVDGVGAAGWAGGKLVLRETEELGFEFLGFVPAEFILLLVAAQEGSGDFGKGVLIK